MLEPVSTRAETETIDSGYSRPEGGYWSTADGQNVNSMNLTFEAVDALEEEVDSNTLPDKQKKPNNASAATEAAKQKFIEGLEAFNQGNYAQARAAWIAANQLDPNNKNSALNGLMKRIDAVLLKENNQVNSEVLNLWIKFNKELENKYQGIKEKQIKEFNNQFLSYSGNDVKKEIIYNLLELSGRNMEKYEEDGEDIFRIYLSEGTRNIKFADELKSKIEKSGKQFNVNLGYDSDGKINIVEIRGYKKQQ